MELGRPGNNNRVQKKRKAESQDNERLSKRLSLLNLERNGQKLYVPVEAPTPSSASPLATPPTPPRSSRPATQLQDDTMQLDDTKHKVYIYDLDAELSDSDTSDDGRLVFLPDISKHLRETRIPPSVLANPDGELAGMSKEMVLYNVPSSLSVPQEQDSVRKAIVEARARIRATQEEKRSGQPHERAREDGNKANNISFGSSGMSHTGTDPYPWPVRSNAQAVPTTPDISIDDDPDAMDLG